MTSRLMLICQGVTAATRLAAFPDDEPLDEKGRQAAQSARIDWRAERGWVSPMLAARQTAEALNVACEEHAGLRDLDYGGWAGRTIAAVAEQEPDRVAQWLAVPQFDGHGGESIAALVHRAGSWLDGPAAERGRTVAVTHAALVKSMIVHVLGAPPEAFWRIDIAPLSRTMLSHDGRRWALHSCGSTLQAG